MRAELQEGCATPELFACAKGYFRLLGRINPDHQPSGFLSGIMGSVRLATLPVTADQAGEFQDDLQDGLPKGWHIGALFEGQGEHHQLNGYELQVWL